MGRTRVFGHKKQWPASFVGERMGGGYVGVEEIRFVGSGLIGTNFGIGSIDMSRVATGLYNIQFPSAPYVGILPTLETPSGVMYECSIASKNVGSGTAYLQITRAPGTMVPSLYNQMYNPVSGTVVNLAFFVGPTSAY